MPIWRGSLIARHGRPCAISTGWSRRGFFNENGDDGGAAYRLRFIPTRFSLPGTSHLKKTARAAPRPSHGWLHRAPGTVTTGPLHRLVYKAFVGATRLMCPANRRILTEVLLEETTQRRPQVTRRHKRQYERPGRPSVCEDTLARHWALFFWPAAGSSQLWQPRRRATDPAGNSISA